MNGWALLNIVQNHKCRIQFMYEKDLTKIVVSKDNYEIAKLIHYEEYSSIIDLEQSTVNLMIHELDKTIKEEKDG